MVEINALLSISEDNLRFTASRSSGPGGQNVNKVNSRITLELDVRNAPELDDAQKERILTRLQNRISSAGILQVTSQKHRTQSANREEAVRKLAALLAEALTEAAPRKKTRMSRAVKEKRLVEKKRIGERKRLRSTID